MAWFLVNSDDLRRVGGGPVDPGYGRPGFGAGHPDNTLPGGPVDPGFGVRPPVDPGYGRPDIGWGHPDNSLPWAPGHPGNRPPGSWGGRPDNSLPWAPGHPSHPISGLPGIDNSLPGTIPGLEPPPTKPIDPDAPLTGYVVVFVPGHGYKVVTIPVEPPVPPTEPAPK